MSQNCKENLEDVCLLCNYGGKGATRQENNTLHNIICKLHNIICKLPSEKDYRKDDFI